MEVAMDGGARIRRRPKIRLQSRPPRPLTQAAQRIYDGVNKMRQSDPERFKVLMEELNPKPVEPPKYDPQVLKRCQDAVFEQFGPAKLEFIPVTVADLSEAACADEFEAYMYTRMANSSPNQLDFTIINPATRLPDQVFKDMIILRYRHQEEPSETPPTTSSSSGIPHALLGSSSSSVLKRHREDSTETLVAPSGSGMLKRHREDLHESSEPMVADSSAPTSGVGDKGEEPGESESEKVATTCGGDN